ncbi:MAG: cob(I)yrinic acid a,c-diamide adenosyltransferase [Phycisphaerales bacterium]
MKIYTRSGDDGTTGLHGGARVSKTHPRVVAYGDLDELNAAIGLVRAALNEAKTDLSPVGQSMEEAQRLLFEIGADLATPAGSRARKKVSPVGPKDIARLEGWIDEADERLAPQRSFILPGGCELASRLHFARVVCRRAEREIVTLRHEDPDAAPNETLAWVNRLSDLLFVLARLANHAVGVDDTPWTPRAAKKGEEPSGP